MKKNVAAKFVELPTKSGKAFLLPEDVRLVEDAFFAEGCAVVWVLIVPDLIEKHLEKERTHKSCVITLPAAEVMGLLFGNDDSEHGC